MFSNIFLKLVHVIKKCVKFCNDRQDRDCSVTCCIVLPYWIIKSTETHSEKVHFRPFLRKNSCSHVSQCYVIRTLQVYFCFYLSVCAWWIRVHNVTSFKQLLDVCNYVVF